MEMNKQQSGYISKLEAKGQDEAVPYQLRMDLKRIAGKAKSGKLSLKVLDRIGESLNDGSYMQNDYYIRFLHILSLKDFSQLPEKGDGMFFFVDTLIGKKKGTQPQQDAAKGVIDRHYSDIEMKLVSKKQLETDREKVLEADVEEYGPQIKLLNEMKEVRWARHKPKSAEEIIDETDDVTVKIESHTTHNQLETIVNRVSNSTYVQEEFPPEMAVKLREGHKKELQIMDEVVGLQSRADELEERIDELSDTGDGKRKVPADQIRKLRKELKDVQKKIEGLEQKKERISEQLSGPRENFEHYKNRMLARYDALKLISEKLGFDVSKPGTKIQCGQDVREIVGIRFGVNDDDDREDWDADHPHTAYVIYKENDKMSADNRYPDYLKFVRDVHALDGYAKIDDINEFNEIIADKTGGKSLAKGDVFYSDKQIFVVQDVSPKGKVTLEKSVISGYETELTRSIANEKYGKRIQREFTFGQFAKLLSSHFFKREIGYEEMQKIVDGNAERMIKKVNGFTEGQDDEQKRAFAATGANKVIRFKVPEENEVREVFYRRGPHVHRAKVSVTRGEKGKSKFNFKEVPFQPRDIGSLLRAGVPLRFGGANWAKSKDKKIENDTGEGKLIDRNPLSEWELIDMVNRGDIMDVPPVLIGGGALTPTQSKPKGRFEMNKDYFGDEAANLALGDGQKENTGDGGEAPDEPEAQDQPNQAAKGPAPAPKPLGYEEALPYTVTAPVGGLTFEKESYLSSLWSNTRMFSVGDFFVMGKTMYEYYTRRFERRQKEKYSSVGTNLPFWAPEMKRINQAAETEEVNQFKETFDQKGILEIQGRLRDSSNKDEVKAAIITLTSKGMMRWEDVGFWKNLNSWLPEDLKIPIPFDGDPYRRLSDDENNPQYGMTGMSYLKNALDALWGEGGYDDWYKGNLSAYRSSASAYAEEGKELEGLEGGHAARLAELLKLHKSGKFVDPSRFEGLLLHAIDNGKADIQDKVYYMIQGVAAVNSDGRTIMPFERMAQINSTYLPRFPILEYLCASVPRPPDGKRYRWTLKDYKEWAKYFDADGSGERCRPGLNVDKFMWKYVITSDQNRTRVNKALRNGEGIDHDDYYAYLPPASVQTVTDTCQSLGGGGGKKFLTVEGYKNVFPGFSQIMRTLSEKGDRNKLRDAINSYIRFEGIMFDRYEKGSHNYQRLRSPDNTNPCVASPSSPKALAGQMNTVIDQIVDAYSTAPGGDELRQLLDLTRMEMDENDLISKEGQDKQKRITAAFNKIPTAFEQVVATDKGQKMEMIVREATKTNAIAGMPFGVTPEERNARKAELKNSTDLAA